MEFQARNDRYDQMQYRRCGRSGLMLPLLSLGLWHNFGSLNDPAEQEQMLLTAFDHGITYFDLADNYGPPYGEAERTFGRILKKDLLPDHLDQGGLSKGKGVSALVYQSAYFRINKRLQSKLCLLPGTGS